MRDRLGDQLRDVLTAGDDSVILAGIGLRVVTETADPQQLIDTIRAYFPR